MLLEFKIYIFLLVDNIDVDNVSVFIVLMDRNFRKLYFIGFFVFLFG